MLATLFRDDEEVNMEKILDIRFSLPDELGGISSVAAAAVLLRLLEELIMSFPVVCVWWYEDDESAKPAP